MTAPSLTQILLDKMNGIDTPVVRAADVPAALNIMEDEALEKLAEQTKGLLRLGAFRVTYFKVDGTESVMECTLDPSLIPQVATEPSNDQSARKSKKPGLVSVYATDRQGWRSFYANKIKMVESL